jgi:TorA maturation chaperone TorD
MIDAMTHLTPTERDVARALGRAALYRLLGAAFAYPMAWGFQELAHVATMAAEAPTTPPAVQAPLAAFAAAARDADPAAVAAEYVLLFDRAARCPPYEGVHAEARNLAGKSARLADVAGFYAAFGLAPASAQPDLEDHVAAELEFMSALAVKEGYARAEGHADGLAVTREAQAAFLADHLGCWAEAFADELRAATPLPFYATAAELLAAWIRVEVTALGVSPARVGASIPPAEEECFTCPMAPDAGQGPPSP